MASNSKKLGELFGGTDDVKTEVLDNVDPSFVSDKNNTSTGYFDLPNGTTAQRPTAASGMIRFNSTIGLAEYYDGTSWKAIDAPPTVSSVSPETFTASGTTITITGANFQSGANVKLIDTNGTELTPDSVTFVSSTSITFDTTQAMIDNENDKFDVKVTNTSGLSGTLDNILEISDGTFSFTNSATSTLYDSGRSSGFAAGGSLSSGGGESDVTISYALTSGSLPTGGSLNTSTGAVTSISAVGSDTVSNFTITATVSDATSGTETDYSRAFALTVKAPTVTSYTSVGSGTFSVPTGTTAVDVLVVGGGGGGGCWVASGAGAGGLIFRPSYPVTPGGSVSYTVGNGGGGAYNNGGYTNLNDTIYQYSQRGQEAPNAAKIGQDSTFGTLTALGGGRGGSYSGPDAGQNGHVASSGGSGGGSPAAPHVSPSLGGTKGCDYPFAGIQPQQPGDSSTYGFGNPGGLAGGSEPFSDAYFGGGGGGAGAAGQASVAPPSGNAGNGGVGKQYDISGSQVYYAGGGGGGKHGTGTQTVSSGGQGGGGNGYLENTSSAPSGASGTANRGGGGGGVGYTGGSASHGGNGGSGIVIVKY